MPLIPSTPEAEVEAENTVRGNPILKKTKGKKIKLALWEHKFQLLSCGGLADLELTSIGFFSVPFQVPLYFSVPFLVPLEVVKAFIVVGLENQIMRTLSKNKESDVT